MSRTAQVIDLASLREARRRSRRRDVAINAARIAASIVIPWALIIGILMWVS